MNNRRFVLMSSLLGLILSLGAARLSAADAPKTDAMAMDPAMAEAMKLGMPSDNHKRLDPLVGKWSANAVMWMAPGGKAEESMGIAENSWILGARFLKQDYKGQFNGQSFEGMGLTGFDNMRQEYQSIWIDNMASGMMQTSGSYDPATKLITTRGSFSCPMTKEKERYVRSELKIVSNDKNLYTSYFKDATGKEFKAMEITYTRIR